MNRITQHTVEKAIATRHKNDMFFTEVKDGSSMGHHSRIDALAIKLSWSSPCITGYEIKIDRSDFIGDNKWMAYLPMCNQLYFATAPGVVQKEEIPEQCGLVQLSANGTQIRTIKKAPYREIEPPSDMFMYLMMKYIGPRNSYESQTGIRAAALLQDMSLEKWKEYLEGKRTLKQMGWEVSKKLREQIDNVTRDAKRNSEYKEINYYTRKTLIEIAQSLGISVYNPDIDSIARTILYTLKQRKGSYVDISKLKIAQENLSAVINEVEKQEGVDNG